MFKEKFKIHVFLILTCTFSESFSAEYDSCTIDGNNNAHGECLLIQNCPSLYSLIKNLSRTPEDVEKLRKAHCGFDGKIPKVCCQDVNSRISDDDGLDPAFVQENASPKPPSTSPVKNVDVDDGVIPKTVNVKNLLPDSSECGADSGRKIVGGEKAELDEFPWMALITHQLPSGQRGNTCGGVLISKKYILTAAHCVRGRGIPKHWKLVSVRLGEYNQDSDEDCIFNGFKKECLQTPPIDVEVEEAIAHEKYDSTDRNQRNDIAIIRLKNNVNYNDYIKPICLPIFENEKKKTYENSNLTVAGWGQTENGSSSSIKLKLSVPVKTNSDCNSIYGNADRSLTLNQMCAGGEDGKDSCKGDSGGPLMSISSDENGDSTWFVAGIVSYGPDPCGTEGWPGVYTRVSKYLGWILKNMKP